MCEFEWLPRAGIFCMSAVVFSCLQSIASAECMWFHVQIAILKLRTLRKISTRSLQKLKLTGRDGRHIPRSLLQIKIKRGHT